MSKKLLIGLAAMAFTGAANASIIPSFNGEPVDVGGGVFAYNYQATLAADQALFSGSYFTLYDVGGFTGFGAVPANWTPTAQLTGRTPSNVLPNDDAAITNVSFTYTGPVVNFSENESENISRELGTFTILSTIGVFGLDDYTSEAIKNSGQGRGTLIASIGQEGIPVPGGGDGTPGAIPEPATWMMLIVGFGLVGVSARRRTTGAISA